MAVGDVDVGAALGVEHAGDVAQQAVGQRQQRAGIDVDRRAMHRPQDLVGHRRRAGDGQEFSARTYAHVCLPFVAHPSIGYNRGMITRRFLMAATSALAAPSLARADSFPNGPIRILVPFGAGSATDNAARNIADGLNRIFGVPVVVDNKPGANGAIAADIAAKSKPDGQTIFVCSNTAAASNVALMKSLPYDPLQRLRLRSRSSAGRPSS